MRDEAALIPEAALDRAPLAGIERRVWSLLQEGVSSAASPFHTPALATTSDDGPHVRTVVLRHIDPAARTISCHTDRRAGKNPQILQRNRLAWLFYDRQRSLQVRLRGDGVLHIDDDIARARWDGSAARSRMIYASPLAPGTRVDQPLPAAKDPDVGRENFAVLLCTIDHIDWLLLRAAGHQRAVLVWKDNAWTAGWVAP